MNPDLRAKLLALAQEMDDSPYERANAYGWQLQELVEKEWPVAGQADARHETHVCAWEYVPYFDVPGVETPNWRCVKRWSDGTRCHATRDKLPTDPQVQEYFRP